MNHEDGTLATDDGLELYWQSWQPPGEPEGVLVFVHGLAEHSGRYLNPVRHFVARGWTCFGFDYRGHGRSPGARAHVGTFDEYLADLAEGHRLAKIRHPGQRIFLVGHSQGGLLSLLYAESGPDDLDGVVVSSPFLGIHPDSRPSRLALGASRIAARLTPKMKLANLADPTFLSRDPAVAEAYVGDPLVSREVTMGWAAAALDAQRKVLAEASLMTLPTLVMQAGADRLADPDASRTWVASAPADLVEYVEWDGFYHELFNEPRFDRRQVFDRMEAWLEAH
ncbi:MAG: lysophospholipase [Thermoanaerobaculales bacterium]|jgi:alpha-beta hydrolase superfamily lysophospholipase|nr:lysophospholipase [Thermoanaerobaculales bacterium]